MTRVNGAAFALLVASSFASLRARADDAAPRDDQAPSGPWIAYDVTRPSSTTMPERACSFRYRTCVHASSRVPRAHVFAVLASVERAIDIATIELDLPPPDADFVSGAYDLYLAPRESTTSLASRDVRSRIDRASALSIIDERLGEGCTLDLAITREVFRAILFRVAPATDVGSARAETEYLAILANSCASFDADAVADFQAHPERTLVDASDAQFDRGAALFFGWLDAKYGSDPGTILRAMWGLSPTMTPLGALRWNDEPDGFDVLRKSFKDAINKGSTLDDLFVDFAASRAFFGANDADGVFREARSIGASGDVRVDWDLAWPDHPRRLASAVPVAPTGSAYVLVRHDGADRGARLRVEIAWEAFTSMKWIALKLDPNHREMSRVVITSTQGATEAQITLDDLDPVSSILFVGTSLGDFHYPFDPDDEVWEPHAWTITLAPQ